MELINPGVIEKHFDFSLIDGIWKQKMKRDNCLHFPH